MCSFVAKHAPAKTCVLIHNKYRVFNLIKEEEGGSIMGIADSQEIVNRIKRLENILKRFVKVNLATDLKFELVF